MSPADGVALARRLGADVVVDGHKDDVVAAARQFAPGGLDAALMTAGGDAANRALTALKDGDRTQGRGNRSFFIRYLYNGVKLSQSPYPSLANSARRFFQITLNQDTRSNP
jgi:D-arabinose 1-dehydrogenase-like Zn-dependent alcohol dehydrogenase